jgi:hypothetical protein
VTDYAGPILGAVGAVIGFYVGGPAGAQWGWAIGSVIGGAYSASQQVIPGPKIGDVQKQTSQEGGFRPIVYGRSVPMMGNVIADSEPKKVTKEEDAPGGKGGPKVETEYAYRTYAVGFCEGESELLQAWRNGILVADFEDPSMAAENAKFLEYARWYTGSFDQMADPDLEAVYGIGNAPFFRGTSYLVLANEDVTDGRGMWSQWQVRVFRGAGKSYTSVPYPLILDESVSYSLTPTGGELREIVKITQVQEEIVNYSLLPVGGELRDPVAFATAEVSAATYSVTPTGGSLRAPIVPASIERSEITYSLSATGGELREALIPASIERSEITYSLTPTGGSLT